MKKQLNLIASGIILSTLCASTANASAGCSTCNYSFHGENLLTIALATELNSTLTKSATSNELTAAQTKLKDLQQVVSKLKLELSVKNKRITSILSEISSITEAGKAALIHPSEKKTPGEVHSDKNHNDDAKKLSALTDLLESVAKEKDDLLSNIETKNKEISTLLEKHSQAIKEIRDTNNANIEKLKGVIQTEKDHTRILTEKNTNLTKENEESKAKLGEITKAVGDLRSTLSHGQNTSNAATRDDKNKLLAQDGVVPAIEEIRSSVTSTIKENNDLTSELREANNNNQALKNQIKDKDAELKDISKTPSPIVNMEALNNLNNKTRELAEKLQQNLITGEFVEQFYYITAESKLNEEQEVYAKKLFELAARYKNINVSIVGRADPRGNYEYNEKLAKSRAKAIEKLALESGIPANSIEMSSHVTNSAIEKNREMHFFDRNSTVTIYRKNK